MDNKRSLLYLGFLLSVIFAIVFGQMAFAEAQKVHALLIILGNDRDIRASVEKNESSMQTLLRQISENCEVHMTVMKSETETIGNITRMTLSNARATNITEQKQGIITANQVVQWIRDLNANSEDTILIYYSGHGSMDAVGTHILNFDPDVTNDFVARDGLRNSLKQKSARLKMLITDTCSNRVQTPPPIARVYAKVQSRERQYTKNLFLEHTGFLDITASSEGQYAWGNDEIGGYFTVSLIGSFTADSDTNQDRFLSWDEVFDVTINKTKKLFSETTFLLHNKRKLDEAGQTSQTPMKASLPVRLTQAEATLNITSTPSGADIYIHGTRVGKTPLENYEIDTGLSGEKWVFVGLRHAGYRPLLWEVMFERGKRKDWNAPLKKLPTTSSGTQTVFWPEMIYIPAGEFQMGSNDSDAEPDEQPVHTVYVDEFYIDRYEVTNAQYKAFIDANPQWRKDRIPKEYHNGYYLWYWNGNNYPEGKADHPVVCVSWYAAMAYAKWAGKRLPTEAEWEKAARGGLIGKKYPWGDSIDKSKANYDKTNSGTPQTALVGKYSPNGYGLYDMAGNVSEWCLDALDADFYASSPRRNPIAGKNTINQIVNDFLSIKGARIVRGGSWTSLERHVRVTDRCGAWGNPAYTRKEFGFRCVRPGTF